jgi:MerR family transcriptional regulator, copper efflux regulator
MARVPVACTLTAAELPGRADEWRGLVARHVHAIERTPTGARLRLADGDDVALLALDLARREKACCGFFEFRLVPLPEATWLEVDAPAEAAPIVDALFASTPE